jgi:hypothetical protein
MVEVRLTHCVSGYLSSPTADLLLRFRASSLCSLSGTTSTSSPPKHAACFVDVAPRDAIEGHV